MMAEDRSGVQTRAMMEAQHTEEETQKQLDNQQEQIQRDKPIVIPEQATPNLDQQNPTMNPTVELHKTSDENIGEFIRRHGIVGLDWYVRNLSNTCVRHLIRDRLPIDTGIHLSPAQGVLHNINFRIRPHHRMSVHILVSPRGHRSAMPARRIRLKPPKGKVPETHRPNRKPYRGTEENPTDQEDSSHSRHHEHGRD